MRQIDPAVPRFETAKGRDEFLSIQYLRAFAALSVLITHVLQWPLADLNIALLKTGRLGVEVFFVISGFIMTMIAGDGAFRPGRFLGRRALRRWCIGLGLLGLGVASLPLAALRGRRAIMSSLSRAARGAGRIAAEFDLHYEQYR